jgi:predicted transcriptional regulator
MRPATDVLRADETLQEALERTEKGVQETWPITDRPGVIGLITRKQIRTALSESNPIKKVGDLMQESRDFPHLHTDHSLELALERMGAARVDVLPVVSRANIHDLLGLVRLRDVLVSYGFNHQGET